MNSKPIKLKNSASRHSKVFELIHKGIVGVRSIENYTGLKLNQEITQSVCNFVESEVSLWKKNVSSSINKEAIATEIIQKAFNLSDSELTIIQSQIQYLLENSLITKSSTLTKSLTTIKSFFSTKNQPLPAIPPHQDIPVTTSSIPPVIQQIPSV
jgi:hypothetical protein